MVKKSDNENKRFCFKWPIVIAKIINWIKWAKRFNADSRPPQFQKINVIKTIEIFTFFHFLKPKHLYYIFSLTLQYQDPYCIRLFNLTLLSQPMTDAVPKIPILNSRKRPITEKIRIILVPTDYWQNDRLWSKITVSEILNTLFLGRIMG